MNHPFLDTIRYRLENGMGIVADDVKRLVKHCVELRMALVEFKTQHVADLDCPVEAGTFCGCDKDVDNARISRALRG